MYLVNLVAVFVNVKITVMCYMCMFSRLWLYVFAKFPPILSSKSAVINLFISQYPYLNVQNDVHGIYRLCLLRIRSSVCDVLLDHYERSNPHHNSDSQFVFLALLSALLVYPVVCLSEERLDLVRCTNFHLLPRSVQVLGVQDSP